MGAGTGGASRHRGAGTVGVLASGTGPLGAPSAGAGTVGAPASGAAAACIVVSVGRARHSTAQYPVTTAPQANSAAVSLNALTRTGAMSEPTAMPPIEAGSASRTPGRTPRRPASAASLSPS
jgi:hypothetical protein